MLIGRHRLRTHAGLPNGSTCNLGSDLQIYYKYNTEVSASLWGDQSPNNLDATQEGEEMAPTLADGGALDFEDTNDPETASQMGFTKFTISSNEDFLSFIVCKLETNSTVCYLSDSGSEVLQFTSGNQHQLKTAAGASAMTHSGVFTCATGERVVFMIHRTNGSTGTIKLYKNGLLCNGHNNSGTTNAGAFELQNLGVKNNPSSESNWFDGIMYEVGVIKGSVATDKNRDMITDYLCCKFGIKREGNN